MQQHMHKILFCENKILFCVMKKEFIFAKFNMHLLLHMFAFFYAFVCICRGKSYMYYDKLRSNKSTFVEHVP